MSRLVSLAACATLAACSAQTPAPSDTQAGYNQAGHILYEDFRGLEPGDEAPAELGGQGGGTWMFVAGARTNGLPEGTLRADFTATLGALGDTPLSKVTYPRRPLRTGDDGYTYISNMYMILPRDHRQWDGYQMELRVTLRAPDGTTVEDVCPVRLVAPKP